MPLNQLAFPTTLAASANLQGNDEPLDLHADEGSEIRASKKAYSHDPEMHTCANTAAGPEQFGLARVAKTVLSLGLGHRKRGEVEKKYSPGKGDRQ